MKPKQICVAIAKIHQKNPDIKPRFLLTSVFEEVIKDTETQVCIKNIKGYNNLIHIIDEKFKQVSEILKDIDLFKNVDFEAAWKYLYATTLARRREELFPVECDEMRKEKELKYKERCRKRELYGI